MLDSRHSTSLDFLRYLLQAVEKDLDFEYLAVETARHLLQRACSHATQWLIYTSETHLRGLWETGT